MIYTFFGLRFVTDEPLGQFPVHSRNGAGDVRLVFSPSGAEDFEDAAWLNVYRSHDSTLNEGPSLLIEKLTSGEWLRVRYSDGGSFLVNRAGTEVRASWAPPLTFADIVIYLLGSVAGLLLYLRGATCLHASAIAYAERTIVLVGAAEAGKSTLASALALLGHRVLTDDILVLRRTKRAIVAKPGTPWIGLWPQSVEHLWGNAGALPRQVPTWDKCYLDLAGQGLYQDSPLPVGAIYLLANREPSAEFRITPIAGTDAVVTLIAHKYMTRISDREQDRRDFALFSELAATVPVRRVTRNNSLSDLSDTCESILTDYASLAIAPA